MGLDNLVEKKVMIKLGGQEYQVRFPVKAFRKFQERFGGWVKAWNAMANMSEDSAMKGEINYDVLAEILVIAIGKEAVDLAKVTAWLDDLMQDEVETIIKALVEARTRWMPEPKKEEGVGDGGDPQGQTES